MIIFLGIIVSFREKTILKFLSLRPTCHLKKCFQTGHHKWLLSEEVDLLPSLLFPLAGPEQFKEEEMEKLPEDLQYLPDDKTREPDADIRKMLLDALTKVSSKIEQKLK